ncbi:uncharacterized protein LOC127852470 [Dreissena polymorpha]|uniref:uncharacterized protein LOC127852470 n=1 Tax=Dreissena polymorpha TaxID=45954 RepID=UPI0022640375|nr:uncharacterized protein LOC127852470 [Dreissena polymorpha]
MLQQKTSTESTTTPATTETSTDSTTTPATTETNTDNTTTPATTETITESTTTPATTETSTQSTTTPATTKTSTEGTTTPATTETSTESPTTPATTETRTQSTTSTIVASTEISTASTTIPSNTGNDTFTYTSTSINILPTSATSALTSKNASTVLQDFLALAKDGDHQPLSATVILVSALGSAGALTIAAVTVAIYIYTFKYSTNLARVSPNDGTRADPSEEFQIRRPRAPSPPASRPHSRLSVLSLDLHQGHPSSSQC